MDLHDLHSLIAGAKPATFSSAVPHFMPAAHHLPPPGYAAAAPPLPEQYRLLLAGSSGGEVELPPTPLQPQPPPPPPPPVPPPQQQLPGMESFAFFDTAFGGGPGGGGQGRWPRQETLMLLEVRSRLDSKFREAAHKGPLWDEVSRIMAEEHGYERSGKKCREKLENLYKYYKKTKEGKAGRQDGKHYRFFRQLEALYGGSSCNASAEIHQPYAKPAFIASHPPPSRQVKLSAAYHTSLSNSPSGFSESSSSDENGDDDDDDEDEDEGLLRMGGKSWRSKVAELIDAQIKRFIEVQEAWMNEMLQTLEHMEQARISREEDWRREEAARFDRECSLWAGERAWIEARDAAIMQALEKISHRRTLQQQQQGREEDEHSQSPESRWHGQFIANGDGDSTAREWAEAETASLIKIRSGMEAEFRREGGGKGGCSNVGLWEEVSAAMSCLGYTRSARRCRERWEDLNRLSSSTKSAATDCYGKKRRKKSKMTTSKLQENSCSERSGGCDEEEQRSDLVGLGIGDEGTASHSSYVNGVDDESSFLFSVGQEESCLWENHRLRNRRGDGS